MALFYCDNCEYPFTEEDVSVESRLIGEVSCPTCNCLTEVPNCNSLSASDTLLVELFERVERLEAELVKLQVTSIKLEECPCDEWEAIGSNPVTGDKLKRCLKCGSIGVR